MVRIFPRAAKHAKNAALKGTLVCQTLLQGKWQHHSIWVQDFEERGEDIHLQVMRYSSKAYILLIGAAIKASFAQAMLNKFGKASFRAICTQHIFQKLTLEPFPILNMVWLENFPQPLKSSKWASIKASFTQEMLNKSGKASFRAIYTQRIFQKLTLEPLPILNMLWLENFPQTLVTFFHKSTYTSQEAH